MSCYGAFEHAAMFLESRSSSPMARQICATRRLIAERGVVGMHRGGRSSSRTNVSCSSAVFLLANCWFWVATSLTWFGE